MTYCQLHYSYCWKCSSGITEHSVAPICQWTTCHYQLVIICYNMHRQKVIAHTHAHTSCCVACMKCVYWVTFTCGMAAEVSSGLCEDNYVSRGKLVFHVQIKTDCQLTCSNTISGLYMCLLHISVSLSCYLSFQIPTFLRLWFLLFPDFLSLQVNLLSLKGLKSLNWAGTHSMSSWHFYILHFSKIALSRVAYQQFSVLLFSTSCDFFP